MGNLHLHLLRLQVAIAVRMRRRRRDDRGDVPGWVLVTVMSAALVMGIWGVAEGQLKEMLRTALNQVK